MLVQISLKNKAVKNKLKFFFLLDQDNHGTFLDSLHNTEAAQKESKLLRFAIDYCRASPNIFLKQKNILNIGWRNTKFHFDVDIEIYNNYNYKNEVFQVNNFLILQKQENSILSAIPINKALINFDDMMIKESFVNLFQSLNHKNLSINLHFEILKNQNLLIKIQKFYESGSLKDLLFKSVIF